MASETVLCSDLLERLKKMMESQDECRLKSEEYLSTLKSSPVAEESFKQNDDLSERESSLPLDTRRIKSTEECDVSFEESSFKVPNLGHLNKIYGTINFPTTDSVVLPNGKDQLNVWSNCNEKNECVAWSNCSEKNSPIRESGGDLQGNTLQNCDSVKLFPKFPFLKKGEGTSRFRTNRTFKGFKNKPLKTEINRNVKSFNGDKNRSMKTLEFEQKLSKFEKLEELVEQDSFCSTSSKVVELLEDDSTTCSTPLSKRSFIATVEVTPVFKRKNKLYQKEKSDSLHFSPIRKLFPRGSNSRPILNTPFSEINNAECFRDGISHTSSTLKNNCAGILKKGIPNTPSLLRVKFLEEGAKVLEYDDPELERNDSTCCSDDSDLISFSDLENLALLNFNVNVLHESSLPIEGQDTLSNQCIVLGNRNVPFSNNFINKNLNCLNTSKKDVFLNQNRYPPPPVKENVLPSTRRSSSVQQHSLPIIKKVPVRQSRVEEDLDVKSHKMLLLAKVEDLTKEIGIFKKKNAQVEKLIDELQKEKRNIIEHKNEEINTGLSKPMKRVNSSLKPLNRNREKNARLELHSNDVILNKKLQDLNEKLMKLQLENNKLKRKVLTLQKKEKEKDGDSYPIQAPNTFGNFREPKKFCKAGEKSANEKSTKKMTGNIAKPENVIIHSSNLVDEISFSVNEKNISAETSSTVPEVRTGLELMIDETKEQNVPDIVGVVLRCGDGENEFSKRICDSNPQHYVELSTEGINREALTGSPRNLISSGGQREIYGHEAICSASSKGLGSLGEGYQGPPDDGTTELVPDLSEAKPFEIIDVYPSKNISSTHLNESLVDPKDIHINSPEGSRENTRCIQYPNGDRKTISAQKVVYYYAENQTSRTLYVNEGKEEIDFGSGQKEIYFKDGSYQLLFPDNSSKSVYKDGSEVCVWRDGTVIRTRGATKSVEFPNGQKEISDGNGDVRRVYPDGTTKVLYADGTQETRYRNGRVRVKDKEGNVISGS